MPLIPGIFVPTKAPAALPTSAPPPAPIAPFTLLPFLLVTPPVIAAPAGPAIAPPRAVAAPSLTSSGKTLISFLLLTPSPVIFLSSLSFFSIKLAKPSLQEYSSLAAIALPIFLRRLIRYLSVLS